MLLQLPSLKKRLLGPLIVVYSGACCGRRMIRHSIMVYKIVRDIKMCCLTPFSTTKSIGFVITASTAIVLW